MDMRIYKRYVDDSNQIAVVPPVGTVYDKDSQRLVVQQQQQDPNITEDERLADILLDIANSVMECVTMEGDTPSKNNDGKLPILEMKVWTDSDGILLYQHYEKPVSSKTVLNARSAHSAACKRSVHTQEVIRRLLNCSHRLSWEADVAPFVTDYMNRMKSAGYGEKYRKDVLEHALRIYDSKWEDDKNGIRPIFRPKEWKKEERKECKEKKRHEWSTKGGYIAPIFIPSTPGSELLRSMREVAKREAKEGIHFKIVEMGGRTLKAELQRSNPTATPGCAKDDCVVCETGRGGGGQCHKNNVNYKIECHLCPEGERAVYIGETARNLYTRAAEHRYNSSEEGSFKKKHMEENHEGMQEQFVAQVTHANRDCLTRQVREGVLIRRCTQNIMNTKAEWYQPALYRVQSEVIRN